MLVHRGKVSPETHFLNKSFDFFFWEGSLLLRCLLSLNLSRIQPVLTGAVTEMVSLGTGPFVTLLTAVLGFPHLCYTFRISFSLNSVAQTMQPNVLGLKVRYGFHLTHLLLQYAHVFFAWAAGEDELCSNVNSFKVILSLFSAYICVNML